MSLKTLKERITKIKTLEKIEKAIFKNEVRQYINYLQNRKKLIEVLGREQNKKREQLQFPKTASIIFIGTRNYINYFPEYYKKIKQLFLPNTKKTFFVFTDRIKEEFLKKSDIKIVPILHEGAITMLRAYEHMNQVEKQLKKQDYLIWIDADMMVMLEILEKDFFCHEKQLFVIRHPNFLSKKGNYETNPRSLAGIKPGDNTSMYVQACFWGGKSKYALDLIKELDKRIKTDSKNNISAIHQDESHLNKYFIENRNLFHVYDPTYAYPDTRPIPKKFKKKILHVYNRKFKS